jgi:extradiol dioxygenase family protein
VAESPPFHLAFPVRDLAATERFYVDLLGCEVGRRSERWIDLDFHGHQLTAHLVAAGKAAGEASNPVDGDAVPVPHFGVILDMARWRALVARLRAAGAAFVIGPRVRFEGLPGEQATAFLRDPSGNAIELKAFDDPGKIFEDAKPKSVARPGDGGSHRTNA